MRINFESITYQNFLSTGSSPNTIDLNRAPTTAIVGLNGGGKSTLLDGITFALFGKPFRNISKPQLINSINQKNCLVTIKFSINDSNYIVKRGMKPSIFEIYLNGELINQDAASKDYQKVLEQQILKLTLKTFTQTVILGSASFVPFMQLPTGQRREVNEDILDIGIFSTMNTVLKEQIVITKSEIENAETHINLAKTAIQYQKRIIENIEKSNKEQVDKIVQEIKNNKTIIKDLESKNLKHKEASQVLLLKISKLDSVELTKANIDIKSNIDKLEALKEQAEEMIEFFNGNQHCPSCSQGINHEHKHSMIYKLVADINKHDAILFNLRDSYKVNLKDLTIIKDTKVEMTESFNLIKDNNFEMDLLLEQNKKLNTSKSLIENNSSDLEKEKAKLKSIADEAVNHISSKNKLLYERGIQDVTQTLLKDTGIKTAIIREYLPIMNKLINGYLSTMDLFVNFELDENFSEVIKSRHRDDFSYASFSEGEKKRIDLALLFTWRQIAKMKNSVNTNLLILDEVLDTAIDSASTDLMMQVLRDLSKDTNVFVITHKVDGMHDKFHSVIEFEKKNDFSVIKT